MWYRRPTLKPPSALSRSLGRAAAETEPLSGNRLLALHTDRARYLACSGVHCMYTYKRRCTQRGVHSIVWPRAAHCCPGLPLSLAGLLGHLSMVNFWTRSCLLYTITASSRCAGTHMQNSATITTQGWMQANAYIHCSWSKRSFWNRSMQNFVRNSIDFTKVNIRDMDATFVWNRIQQHINEIHILLYV